MLRNMLYAGRLSLKSSLKPVSFIRQTKPLWRQTQLFSTNTNRSTLQKLFEGFNHALLHDERLRKLHLTQISTWQTVATANFSQVREEEIALLSNVSAKNTTDKKLMLDLLKNYLGEKRADLFYYEKSKDISHGKFLEKSHYDYNVMVLSQKRNLSDMKVVSLDNVISDKSELIKPSNIESIKNFLLANSYWAEKEGLTNEMVINRIKESDVTLAIIDPVKGCKGFISYFTNGEIGYLYNMVVNKGDRGRGIGKALLHKIYQSIPENQVTFLISATEGASITVAKELYKKFGFEYLQDNPNLREYFIAADIPKKSNGMALLK